MNITQHPSNNGVLGAPRGMSHELCTAAPITRVHYPEDDIHAVRTYWRPTATELAALQAGATVCLELWTGPSMPPALLTVDGVAYE